MIDQTDDGLRAAIKALDEVVAPALDAANPLAVEQLRLVSRFLGFVRSRAEWQLPRDRFELRHQLELARVLHGLAPAEGAVPAREGLAEAIAAASTLPMQPDAPQAALRAAIDALSAASSVLVRSVADAPEAVRRPIEREVVRASRSLLDAHRAWFLPMGFEPDASQVPSLPAALAAPR